MAGQDHQARSFEGAGPTDRVERVLQVVGTGRDLCASGAQGSHSGESSRHRAVASALEEQVGVGERNDADACRRNSLRRRLLIALGLH